MLGKDLINFIVDNKMQDKDVHALIRDDLFVTSFNIEKLSVSDEETDDCVFAEINVRPHLALRDYCTDCCIFNFQEIYKGPLSCYTDEICEKKRHTEPTKEEIEKLTSKAKDDCIIKTCKDAPVNNYSFNCPRRTEDLSSISMNKDVYRDDNTCSYCGSYNPELLMSRLEKGELQIEPTDKNYKIYLHGNNLPQSDGKFGKFYFRHLNESEQNRFFQLANENKIEFAYPGNFYVKPFFFK